MESKALLISKLLTPYLFYSKPFKLTILISCFFLLFSFSTPICAQQESKQIENLKRKIKEALIKDVFILSTTIVESSKDLPKHLVVRGYTMPANHFLLRLPIDDWNGKSFVAGCGAGCGELPMEVSGKSKFALKKRYATAIMNTGHWAPSKFDFSWAFNNREAEKNYAYRAIHDTHQALEKIINIFYDQESLHSYFWGCSGGGRQAIMAAARYPKDFDGIISEGPALDFTGEVMLLVWLRQTNTGKDGKDIITKEDIPLIKRFVYETCDKKDGKVDGLISSAEPCDFNPEVLICKNDNSKNCLNFEKVEVLKKWYQGPVNSNGDKLFVSGLALGSEPFWKLWLLGKTNEPLDELLNSESMLRYISFKEDPGEQYSVFDFDFDKDPNKMKYMGSLLNVDNLSLKPFKDHGGKLLMFHGLSDPAIPYHLSVDFYKKKYKKFGKEINSFLRLFLIPGMDHCSVLPYLGITKESVDPISLLEKWVEKNKPPLEFPVTQFTKDGIIKDKFFVPIYTQNK